MKTQVLAGLVASTMLTLVAPAKAATVAFGATSGNFAGDCTPGCTPQFQTVYSGSAFGSSPVLINAISYFLAGSDNQPVYTINLSTSRNGLGSLSSIAADNIGADVATFFTGAPSGLTLSGAWYTFTGTPFLYNPLAGDLLVDFAHIPAVNGEYLGSSYSFTTTNAQRGYSFSDTGPMFVGSPGYVIDTQFTVSTPNAAAAVPEPATWLTMILGFAVLGGAMRRRQSANVRFNFA